MLRTSETDRTPATRRGFLFQKRLSEPECCITRAYTVFDMAVIGYARVSTREQNPESQAAELRAAGAEQVFTDRGESSREAARPQWIACKAQLKPGDTLVIRALDRVAGTERMAIETIRELGERGGIRLRSLSEPFLGVDTSTPMGEAIVGIMAVMAQLRVSMIRENTRRGLAHARAQGESRRAASRHGCRPHRDGAAAAQGREKLCADRQDPWCQCREHLPFFSCGKPLIQFDNQCYI